MNHFNHNITSLTYVNEVNRLVLAGRSQEKLFEVQEQCTKLGSEKSCIYPLDVSKQDECRY